MDGIPSYSETDLATSGALPADWSEDIFAAVESAAVDAILQGGGETSLEPAGTDLSYRLLDGLAVERRLPWLSALYRNSLSLLASRVCGHRMVASRSRRTGVNVNVLDGPGGRYELHVDSNPLTGLLFVTAHDAGSGGQLLFETGAGSALLDPRPGLFITFDARRLPHSVTPLKRESPRISVPMNFYPEGQEEGSRRDVLDSYLYGDQEPRDPDISR